MESPNELSLREIRDFMLKNNCKVTNHALVKHFKRFLTNPDTQNEARKQFKTYVNILATIKNENNEKFLILRKKYLNECPPEDIVDHNQSQTAPTSPGGHSIFSEGEPSPFRQPPPYKPPPEVSPVAIKLPVLQSETVESYRDCVSEFQAAVAKIDPSRAQISSDSSSTNSVQSGSTAEAAPPSVPPRKRASVERSFSREGSIDQDECNKENVAQSDSHVPKDDSNKVKICENDNKISVKEATKKFNRMASEEEAKVVSPTQKKKPEKPIQEDKMSAEVTLAHPKAKEWIVAAAKSSYQDLAKLASENPELVKLHDPTGYTALHWAAKHGNEDVVKLIAGTYKADVNARTNGGYTPLHLSMQFGRDNIFELLCNVYRANRDIADWSGKKALDYRQQRTTVSASTYSKIKARRKQSEKDLGFLRIGSLNVRVKKTTEAFSNFLGVGGGNTNSNSTNHHQHPHHPHHHSQTGMMTTTSNRLPAHLRSSAPPMNNYFEKIHKSWGSADNIPQNQAHMPPPKNISMKKKRSKRSAGYDSTGFSSMPTTPNQVRAPIGVLAEKPKDEHQLDSDSDSAFGFDSSWSKNREKKPNVLSGNADGSGNDKINPTYI